MSPVMLFALLAACAGLTLWWLYGRPSTRRVPSAPMGVSSANWRQLLSICHGDAVRARRVLEGEQKRLPQLSPDEACRSAIQRWMRDAG